MTSEELWDIYVARNPGFVTDGATLSAAGLRKFFDQTWRVAYRAGQAANALTDAEEELLANEVEERRTYRRDDGDRAMQVLKRMFGME